MTYDEIIEQLEITKSKIKEIARNEYGGESWNDDLNAMREPAPSDKELLTLGGEEE